MATATATATTTISRRNRNLSLGWTTTPVRDPETGRLVIDTPGAPDEQGGPATLRKQYEHMRRVVGTDTYHRYDLFVGGKRVVNPARFTDSEYEFNMMLADLMARGGYEEVSGSTWEVELE